MIKKFCERKIINNRLSFAGMVHEPWRSTNNVHTVRHENKSELLQCHHNSIDRFIVSFLLTTITTRDHSIHFMSTEISFLFSCSREIRPFIISLKRSIKIELKLSEIARHFLLSGRSELKQVWKLCHMIYDEKMWRKCWWMMGQTFMKDEIAD